MPDNTVKIVLEAADKTKEAFNSVKASSEGLLSSLKSHWLEFTAAGASIYGLIKGIQEFTNAASQAQQIESRMAFQISAAGINYEKVKGTIDAYAASVQNATRFSSETAQQGLGQMMMYTSDLGKALDGTRLAMDMATQAGMDLGSAVRIVGYAMEGNIEMVRVALPQLRQLDTVLGDNATKAEKTAYSMKVLNEMFGGAGAKDVETYAGKMKQLSNSIEEVKKGIGEKLLDAVQWAKKQDFFKEWWAGVDSLLNITGRATEAQKKLKEGMAAVKEESQKTVAAKELNDYINYIDKWQRKAGDTYTLTDELNRAFEQLGITSTRSMADAADTAVANVARIKKALEDGKASVDDYKKALLGAAAALQNLIAPDATKAIAELEKKYQEGAKKIREEGGDDFRKKIEAWGDQINEEMKKITGPSVAQLEATVRDMKTQAQSQLDKDPMRLKLDTADFLKKMDGLFKQAQGVADANPITVRVNVEQTGTVGGQGSGVGAGWNGLEAPPGWIGEGGTEYNVTFTGEASPKKPLSETMADIMNMFQSMQGMMEAINANIKFVELSMSLKDLTGQLTGVRDLLPSMYRANVWGGGGPVLSFNPELIRRVGDAESDLMSRLSVTRMQMLGTLLSAMGPLVGYQEGTPYVPKTGVYLLHKGEQVRTTNQVSMGGVTNIFQIKSSDPQGVAREVARALKYELSGDLKDVIKKISS